MTFAEGDWAHTIASTCNKDTGGTNRPVGKACLSSLAIRVGVEMSDNCWKKSPFPHLLRFGAPGYCTDGQDSLQNR
jgi:hypothetical protein